MAYIVCPTCNRLIGDKIIMFDEGIKKICDDPTLTPEQQTEKQIKLMDSLKIPKDRYCCRMRLMTYRDLVTIVK
jgi:DNA-directed RNA polymerase subunit N (RpoN/RPB10)